MELEHLEELNRFGEDEHLIAAIMPPLFQKRL